MALENEPRAHFIVGVSLRFPGQRCVSEREPELGLGVVASVEGGRIEVSFPATNERRIYAAATPVLKRVMFRVGESVVGRSGASLVIESVEEECGLLVYAGAGTRMREDEISDVTSVNAPVERLLAGQADPNDVFDLRWLALVMRERLRSSPVRGFLGGRIDLLPHQFFILNEVASRQLPRVLLADEVGLGKTIEACLILHRLLEVGKVKRALILVPESLVHQWFVELLRRFNLWFTIIDEARCAELESRTPEANPFASTQLALCSVTFAATNERRAGQVADAGWDLVIVDEAHHLAWTPERVSAEYALVEALAAKTPGLLLLTATPTQLGLEGHFARLRLLDPARYRDLVQFREETERYTRVASVANRLVEGKPIDENDATTLAEIFTKDPERLAQHLAAVRKGARGAREALLRTLLDQHGTGRVVFRNTRAALSGFPKRKFCPAPIDSEHNVTLLARIARELQAEEAGGGESVRYSFKGDPRLAWLVGLLKDLAPAKVLLICKSQRKVLALAAALQELTATKVGLFHEGLALVQRDRNAAWFAEPEGAQLLVCSEIGSEGRNFQFAHHLVLFDLPLNPGLVEQRIGRLDRIGQTETIRIHVPYVMGSADEVVLEWYHRGLNAFEAPLQGGPEFQDRFGASLFALAATPPASPAQREAEIEKLVDETAAFREALAEKMRQGRDRLLELNSFDVRVAGEIVERVRAAEDDPALRRFLFDLLDHFGVRVKEHEHGELFLDPSHAYVESFPSIDRDGMLATFERRRALAREDVRFLSADHALVRDAIDLLVESPRGCTAFGTLPADEPNLLLEVVFVLETVADSRWHVDQFLAPGPVRVVVDVRGNDLTGERPVTAVAGEVDDGDLQRFLDRPGFSGEVLKGMREAAERAAEALSENRRRAALNMATAALGSEIERLIDLRKRNDLVRAEEIELAREQLGHIQGAIRSARLRLDSLRLIIESPVEH